MSGFADKTERRRRFPMIGDTAWDAHERAGHLPKRYQITPKRVGWALADLEALEERIKSGWTMPPLPRRQPAQEAA